MLHRILSVALLALLSLLARADTIGNTGTPNGGGNTGGDTVFATQLLTMPVAGTFTSISVHAADESGTGTRSAIVRIYDSSGNTLATSSSASGWSGSGSWVAVPISYAASASQQLRFAIISEGAPLYISVTTDQPSMGFLADGPTYPGWPTDPVTFNADQDWLLALYGTYTPSGGGSVPVKFYHYINGKKK